MKLLSLVLIFAIANSGFAKSQRENEDKKLKQALVVGGTVVAVIVGWPIMRRANYKLFEVAVDKIEKTARRSRMALANFTEVEITDPPLYRLTAPDGSQHHILGTMHISNLSLSDFAKDSKLFPILEQANILMPEFAKARFTQVLKYSLMERRPTRRLVSQRKLSQQLGEQHWQKLTEMIAEKPDLKPFEQPLDQLMAKIDTATAGDVYDKLLRYGFDYATPTEGLKMDFQLIRYGRQHGKTLIGLETFKQGSSAALKARLTNVADVNDLKELIDKGGIDYVTDTLTDSIHHYANGALDESVSALLNALRPARGKAKFDNIMLDQRNIAWVESGKIQKNCVQGNNCLVFVGLAHLTEGNNTLIKLLQKQGYQIERIAGVAP